MTIANTTFLSTKVILSITGNNLNEKNCIIFKNWYLRNVTWNTVASLFTKKGFFNLLCSSCYFYIGFFNLMNVNFTKSKIYSKI